MALTSLRARVVFPVEGPPIEHGVVTIGRGRILAVDAASRSLAGKVHDLGPVALLPGLVNAHTHLEFSALPRPLGKPEASLVDWIRLVIAERGRRVIDAANAISAGVRESLSHGVTTIGDIASVDAPQAYSAADATLFLEVIGFSRARAASAAAAVVARLDEFTRFGHTQVGVSPHAPYTVSPELLKQLVALARERNLPVAMHLAESAEEIEFLGTGRGALQHLLEERSMWDLEAIPPGSRPLDYLRLLVDAPRSLVIHGNYLDNDERAFLAAHRDRMSLVYCPRTHAYFAHPPYRLAGLLGEGVHVALGTDSRASNPDLSLLAEVRHAARTHAAIEPHEILRLGTMAGAIALGRADDVGSLTPGKLANMIAVPIADGNRGTAADMLADVFSNDAAPSAVWLRGRRWQL